jgi:hypothetical protein
MPPYNPQLLYWYGDGIRWHQWPQQQAIPIGMVQDYQWQAIDPAAGDEEGNMINDFKVGCDPEFMLLNGEGGTVAASTYFPLHGEIGYDHGGRVAEFRPEPTRGVFPIIKKIQSLVEKAKAVAPGRLRAGAICNRDCLGGHVHFGFNCFTRKPPEGCGALLGGELNARGAQVTKALDTLTKTLEHLDILPSRESAARRASAQGQGNYYGAYGDVRDCHGHMEYRTMASWLYDPKVAFLCLTAAKLAAADPEGTIEKLRNCDGFAAFEGWLTQYKSKDVNAARASEKLLERGLRHLQVDPDVDFRGRWEQLGL